MKISPRIIDVSQPKKVEDIKMALTGKISMARLQRMVLDDIKRIIQRCDAERYPTCIVGVSSDGYREIRWPGVSVVMDVSSEGIVSCEVIPSKRIQRYIFSLRSDATSGEFETSFEIDPKTQVFEICERDPSIACVVDSAETQVFERLIATIGVFVLFKMSKPVDVEFFADLKSKTPRDWHYGITLPVKLEHRDSDMENLEVENFPFHFEDVEMARTV